MLINIQEGFEKNSNIRQVPFFKKKSSKECLQPLIEGKNPETVEQQKVMMKKEIEMKRSYERKQSRE